jgi:MFS transporter, DHA1 family, tetracycline resistance protein
MKLTSFRDKISFVILLITAGMDWFTFGLVFPIYSSFIFRPELQFLPAHVSNLEKGIWLGILLALGPGISFFSSTILGVFSDTKGRKKVLQLTLSIVAIGFLISTLGVALKNLFFVLIGRMVMGIGGGNTAIVNAAIADVSIKNEKAKRYSLVSMANGIGFTVGPFLGGALSGWLGYESPFLFAGLITLFNLMILSFFFTETHQIKTPEQLKKNQKFKQLLEVIRISGIPVLFFCFFIYSIGWSFYWEFIPVTWIEGYQLKTDEIGILYAYGSLFYVLSSGLLIHPILKRFPPLMILFFAWTVLALTLVPLLYMNMKWFWIYIPLQQFLMALLLPTGVALISNLAHSSNQGKMMGAFQSLQTLAFVTSPLLGGVILNMSDNMPIYVGIIAMSLASLILLLNHKSHIFRLKKLNLHQ